MPQTPLSPLPQTPSAPFSQTPLSPPPFSQTPSAPFSQTPLLPPPFAAGARSAPLPPPRSGGEPPQGKERRNRGLFKNSDIYCPYTHHSLFSLVKRRSFRRWVAVRSAGVGACRRGGAKARVGRRRSAKARAKGAAPLGASGAGGKGGKGGARGRFFRRCVFGSVEIHRGVGQGRGAGGGKGGKGGKGAGAGPCGAARRRR